MKVDLRHLCLLPKAVLFATLILVSCSEDLPPPVEIEAGDSVVMIGGNICSRMLNFGHFETAVHLRNPDKHLTIRNMCDGGDTPGFRPHSGRDTPWAFDGAEVFQDEFVQNSNSQGHLEYPDEWLTEYGADVILAFFGFSESYAGPDGVDIYKEEVAAFIDHTLDQQYNGSSAVELVMISPIPFEDLSRTMDVPNGKTENQNLALYGEAIREVATEKGVRYVDVFGPMQRLYKRNKQLTIDGLQLNEEGYQLFSEILANRVFGKLKRGAEISKQLVFDAVMEKNWFWHYDYKIPNGVHVFGRRYDPFGPDNYPEELMKIKEMTMIRDSAIWATLSGSTYDVNAADQLTTTLPEVETNYLDVNGRGSTEYLYGQEAEEKISVPDGYKIELFASEKEFPDLANPVQLSFDNKGRLWVAVMPTYPHYRPGDPLPNDKLIILEDTDGDNKADKQTVFADNLHIPVGFEFAPEGVYVSQGTNLKLLIDDDGDDQMDREEIVLSGFDDHDTHHTAGAFCADPSGAIYMGEGVFLHTNVETAYGTVRATNGGFYRYAPQRRHLERTAQLSIPNPWGIAFDKWGQNIFAETSGPAVRWMMPGSVKPRYGIATHRSKDLVEDEHKVRPTSGLEFVSSRHFPDDVQGDLLINNDIGFLGTKQHQVLDDGTGYRFKFRQDLLDASDPNFRAVDMEFAPDGSLYFIDWHNVLIGHMQHNARDPLRDHVHGRVYRLTYPSRPLVTPAKVHDASIEELLDNLKLPEYRTRYRTRRELRSRDKDDVLAKLTAWANNLDSTNPEYEHHLLEGLWVSWGLNQVDVELLNQLLVADDFRARAAAVRVLRYTAHQVDDQVALLKKAAADDHGRVRLEAIVTASWIGKEDGLDVLAIAGGLELDDWMIHAHQTAVAHLNGEFLSRVKNDTVITELTGQDRDMYIVGKEIYEREGYCSTCHQHDGMGLTASGFPPLANSEWVVQNEDRLIKLTMNGLHGPITVLGKDYPGQVPMTPYKGLLNNEEIASVLTYVRNSFGNKAPVVTVQKVSELRGVVDKKKGFYSPAELLEEHPHETIVQ